MVAAETRAAEIMTQERLRMEKFFMEMSRHSSGERDLDNKSPSITSGQNVSERGNPKADNSICQINQILSV